MLGLLDDPILLPLGIYPALKLIPAEVMHESRQRVHETAHFDARWGALVIVCLVLLETSLSALFGLPW